MKKIDKIIYLSCDINIDSAQMGLGGIDAWGHTAEPEYRLDKEDPDRMFVRSSSGEMVPVSQ